MHVGVDLGGTNIAAGLTDDEGNLVFKDSVATGGRRPAEEIIKDLASLCARVIKGGGCGENDVKSVGIGSPGQVDGKNGVIYSSNNINFRNTDIKSEMGKYTGLPVFLENDANTAAIAESVCGAAKGCKNSVMITLGTGIGGGVIIDGRILQGAFFGGGDIGHHVIVSGGEECTCGRRGCWEAYASATALIRDTKRAMKAHPESALWELAEDADAVTTKTTFDAADKGDETAVRLISDFLTYVAEGVVNMIYIFQPEIIVLGGGISAQGIKLTGPVESFVKGIREESFLKTKIAAAALGNDAGIIGAAMLHSLQC